LADFSFTSEADSKALLISNDSRGTNCYRAPELVTFDAVYNNKVDIWSMGCILYELAVGRRAFNSDWATSEYKKASGTTLEIHLDEYFSTQCKESIKMYIMHMLQVDSTLRPSATHLLEEFSKNFQITHIHHNVQVDEDFDKIPRSEQSTGISDALMSSIQRNDLNAFK
jgi:serine/threonine protein kinase